MSCRKVTLAVTLLILTQTLGAQTISLYNYQDLSHLYYNKQKDSIQKAWACPALYKNKETQKLYKESWDNRTDRVTSAITTDDYVYDKDVYLYLDGIVNQLVQANKQYFPVKPLLLIDRDPSANAYSTGNHLIAMNLGMVCYAKSREELALIIAHELSHDILNHADNAIREKAEFMSSDDYKKSLNAVLDSKYERLTRLNNVMKGYSFSRNRHQRYKESDADSLAVILMKKSNLAFQAGFFLRLDSSDALFKTPLKNPLSRYFTVYQLPFEETWTQRRSKGLSTRTYNFSDTSKIQDSLKTHPDCIDRYNKTLRSTVANAKLTPVPALVHEKATRMVIWNLYQNMALSSCLYWILQEKDRGNTDEWYDFMVNNVFSALYYADKDLHRFAAIGVMPKELISKDFYQLQNMMEQMPREQLATYVKTFQTEKFWAKVSPQEKALRAFLYDLATDPDNTDKHKIRMAKDFAVNNPASMYVEFANNIDKK